MQCHPDCQDSIPQKSHFLVLRAESLTEAAEKIPLEVRQFVLLVAIDASGLSDEVVLRGAELLLARGAVYICVWGHDCERVHDCFDRIVIDNKLDLQDDEHTIMTTWHAREELDKAACFFRYGAYPTDGYAETCAHWIAISIRNDQWAAEIEKALNSSA